LPLVDGEWRDTTPQDLAAFEASLDGTLQEVEIAGELEARIDRMAQAGPSMAVLVDGNRQLYPQLERLATSGQGIVDIVVPVYNAWHITRKCIEAVRTRTTRPFRIIVVNDASDSYTTSMLEALALESPVITLIRNDRNRGFAASVNRGIRAGKGDYVCLLNSDVLVTQGWLMKMVMALHADPRNAIVCPATNNTAVVDVPLSPGASYLHMAQAFEAFAQRRYPEILPTGFCFLFRRSLLDEIGYFDEAYKNFGEETDFWWRAVKAGHRAVMADDTYVFHERASSFSALGSDAHMSMRKLASGRFNQLWPEWTEWRDAHDVKKALGPLRQPIPPAMLRSPRDRYRVCWLVHDARPCGAMRYIADIVNELCERGVNAKVAVLLRQNTPREFLGELRCAPVFFASMEELQAEFAQRVFPSGLVIAGTVELAPAMQALVDASGGAIRGCLHAQSFDPALTKEPEERAHLEALYKLVPDVIASSRWVADEIARLGPTPFACVHPGVDRTLFYPRDRSAGDERPTVMIPMNPSVWWRGWDRGLELIAELDRQARERGIDLRILVYGVDSLPITSRAICLGVITQTRLATLLGTEVDALVDPSHVHSYGMPCLEAAATEVDALCWENRGAAECQPFAIMPTTGFDIQNMAACTIVAAHVRLKRDDSYWAPLEHHDRERSVDTFIGALESHFKLTRKLLRICVVAPHLRKWGGPTTMLRIAEELARRGHLVEVATVYADVHPAIAADAAVPIIPAPKELPSADLYIVNSDNPWVERISALPLPARRIMLKLSHNPRFKAEECLGLRQDWDAVVTSTQWLVDVCVMPTEGWDYPASEATAIGWWHYEHARFRCPPTERTYGDGSAERPFVIGTLVHGHPTKGTLEALEALSKLPNGYAYRFVGVGEVPPRAVRLPDGFEYVHEPSRDKLTEVMKGLDVWLSCSHSEGLGRMTLEAMSAGAVVVARDTGSEHLKAASLTYASFNCPELMAALFADPDRAAKIRAEGFEVAERAANPQPCMDALEKLIDGIFD
jgi:GT2 family glycosyltransferase/glycosyltransferase involved in cell wall biosynthesis